MSELNLIVDRDFKEHMKHNLNTFEVAMVKGLIYDYVINGDNEALKTLDAYKSIYVLKN